MKLSTYAQNLHDLGILKSLGQDEIILEHKSFSRFGKLSDEQFTMMVARARELGLRVLFEWDILMTQSVFMQKIKDLYPFIDMVDAFRVQDPGALHWVLSQTQKPVQFIAENGNHNLAALNGWIAHAAGRMERIILSLELPKTTIETYLKHINIPCELLGFGRILLFYSPRSLLASLASQGLQGREELTAIGESEESPHKGFPILENQHGTFMFHIKDCCLLEYANDLSLMGLSYFRVDLRWESLKLLPVIVYLMEKFDSLKFESFKLSYPKDLMRGFYNVNKTDILFPKLKNIRLQKREGDYLGEILEAVKGSHLAILVKNSRGIKRSDRLKILHPEGKIFEVEIFSLKNLVLEEVDYVAASELALIQFVGGVWPKSQVFYHGLQTLP